MMMMIIIIMPALVVNFQLTAAHQIGSTTPTRSTSSGERWVSAAGHSSSPVGSRRGGKGKPAQVVDYLCASMFQLCVCVCDETELAAGEIIRRPRQFRHGDLSPDEHCWRRCGRAAAAAVVDQAEPSQAKPSQAKPSQASLPNNGDGKSGHVNCLESIVLIDVLPSPMRSLSSAVDNTRQQQ